MPQEDLTAIAPYDDGSSTESECYDEELLELAASTRDENYDQNLAPDPTTVVKVEAVPPVKAEDATETKPKAQATFKKCKRCRRKLPIVSEDEQAEVQQGKAKTKRCACCCELFPLSKFGLASRSSTRAIPRCRSCSQAPPAILQKLREIPEYADAVAAEKEMIKAGRKEKKTNLPPFERKTVKQRYEEQFQLVRGKTARERRLKHREEQKKKRLASIQHKRQENKKK
ncbi:hypothetical protein PC129_g8438 [Phytophthora cactorum]|uniref:Uncharacterized protein n=2 Tax=Phytophthora cactorum TaxID=29920 RepID=A0A329S460_9STRA|nr:hypothetical protein Pcac1_g11564 [Phytophthora cactorum]KAG2823866.1 hypothetical protein PC112_g10330 [Phytophthora cactorum]KAG2825950.1 hypothetical protein PC111_g9160 [Phytophthora cactorum]KAG2857234.1 hypothetical protein PC113_g10858 [Phytophthora cactorum]KAG2905667.1 hypothetical protein PC114_g11446 [Phytophthora cactorum]